MTAIYLRWHVKSASRIKWFDGQGDHPQTAAALYGPNRPAGRNWDKTVEAVLAHHNTTHVALAEAAAKLYGEARFRMASVPKTPHSEREFNAYVGIEQHDLDWIIFLDDPGPESKRSALSIEFGHLTKAGNRVGGLFILTGAANKMARTSKKRWGN